MRKLIGTICILACITVVVGFARGWFSVNTRTESDNNTKVELSIDRNRIGQDTEQIKQSVKELSNKVKSTTSPAEGTP
jgi:uncharacterized protein YlxW (UPF0749 family)